MILMDKWWWKSFSSELSFIHSLLLFEFCPRSDALWHKRWMGEHVLLSNTESHRSSRNKLVTNFSACDMDWTSVSALLCTDWNERFCVRVAFNPFEQFWKTSRLIDQITIPFVNLILESITNSINQWWQASDFQKLVE